MNLGLGTASYGLAALLLLLLMVAQVRIWATGKSSLVLIGATAISLLWCLLLALQSRLPVSNFSLIQYLEVIKNLAWFSLLLSVLGARQLFFPRLRKEENLQALTYFVVIGLGIPFLLLCLLVYLSLFAQWPMFFPGFGGRSVIAGFLLVAVTGLALLEQVIRNTRWHHLWHLKFLCLSLGMIFTYDVYMFSDALLFNRVQVQLWEARGFVVALAVPLLSISVLRTREQPIQVSISRRLVFHTSVLMAAGAYLLVMALAGVYIRQISGEWGLILEVVFWVISLTLLVVLAYSGRIRSFLRWYINRHLFSSKYDYRDEWMRISRTLSESSADENLPERVIRALSDIVDSSGGALWLTSNDVHFDQVAHLEMGWVPDSGLTSEDYLVKQLEASSGVIDLTDPRADLKLDQLPGWLRENKKAWLIVPLNLNEHLIGFVLLRESRVEFELNWEDHELMIAAGQQAASYLAQMLASEALAEVRQFSAFNQVSAFVVHDLKTLNSQLSLMISNAEKHKHNPDFVEDMIRTTDNAVSKMTDLLKHFRDGSEVRMQKSSRVNLDEMIRNIADKLSRFKPRPQVISSDSSLEVLGNESELESSLTHLVRNAQEATGDDGKVVISLYPDDQDALIRIEDNGAGMSQEFINKQLFKPFESTKGLTGMGLGVFQCRSTIRSMGGDISVRSKPGQGTEFTLKLSIIQPDEC